jgi:60 kDa SS-A/Ro ribonucleoprotein
VIATSVSSFTIADPKDSGMLDIAGFDSAAPQLIAAL